MKIRITPPEEMIEATVSLPESKSIYNRALMMHAIATGGEVLDRESPCDDGDMMKQALQNDNTDSVNVGPAGTAMRFLTAYFAVKEGSDITLDGSERMRKRPIAPLVDALRSMGADIEYEGEEGFPPLKIKGKKLEGGNIEMPGDISSQFLSAVLMVAPTFKNTLNLKVTGQITSLPYLQMTLQMMRRRGIDAEMVANEIEVKPGNYKVLQELDIERDWSAASYWYSIAALSAGWITLEGLKLPSIQGDSRVADIFEKLGVVTNIEEGNAELSASPEVFSRLDLDLSETPDIVQTLCVACGMLGIPFHFSGVSTLRIKETDRIEALKNEMERISCIIETKGDNEIKWDGKRVPLFEVPEIHTYKDHRMALAFAPAAIYIPGLVIRDAEVVNKSYPGFWDDMRSAGFTIEEIE